MYQAKIGHHDAAGDRDEVDLAFEPPGGMRVRPALGEGLFEHAVVDLARRIMRHQATIGVQAKAGDRRRIG